MIARAQRLDKIPPYLFGEIAALKRKALAEGKDLIDMGIGDPDQPTPESIVDALCEAAHDPETHRYDETSAGWVPFLEAAAAFCGKRFGITIDPATEALLLIGSKEGLAHLAWAYMDPGDISLVPDPAYTVYKVNTLMAGGETHTMPLREENGFLPDLTAIPADVAKKAKLLWLNYPNNPTGAVASLDFYADAVAFARDHDLLIVNDAAYSEVYYDDYRPPSLLQIPGAKDVTIELHSLSKTFNMTGWRLGFAIGNPEAIATLNKLKSNLDSKQFPAVSVAGAYALLHGDNRATLELYRRRRDILCDGLNALGWKVPKPKATFYVWARVPEGHTSASFARLLLEEASVNVIPGSGYGEYGEGYVRMSLTVLGDKNGERIQEAVHRIGQHIHF
ncbi:MAG TPA: LL-diaminopimelate aminotransferase [Chthonomonadaceae bacterium]|nr:LL-diaminopimelate aminotransferase [Chthonomonadaceae bacterium]